MAEPGTLTDTLLHHLCVGLDFIVLLLQTTCQNGRYSVHATVHSEHSLLFCCRRRSEAHVGSTSGWCRTGGWLRGGCRCFKHFMTTSPRGGWEGTKKNLSAKCCAKPTSFAELYVIANKQVLPLHTTCQYGRYSVHAVVHSEHSLLFCCRRRSEAHVGSTSGWSKTGGWLRGGCRCFKHFMTTSPRGGWEGTKKNLSAKCCAKPTSLAELYVIANKQVLLLHTTCQNGRYSVHAVVHSEHSLLFCCRRRSEAHVGSTSGWSRTGGGPSLVEGCPQVL